MDSNFTKQTMRPYNEDIYTDMRSKRAIIELHLSATIFERF